MSETKSLQYPWPDEAQLGQNMLAFVVVKPKDFLTHFLLLLLRDSPTLSPEALGDPLL